MLSKIQHIYSNAHKKLKHLEASSKKQKSIYNICKRFERVKCGVIMVEERKLNTK